MTDENETTTEPMPETAAPEAVHAEPAPTLPEHMEEGAPSESKMETAEWTASPAAAPEADVAAEASAEEPAPAEDETPSEEQAPGAEEAAEEKPAKKPKRASRKKTESEEAAPHDGAANGAAPAAAGDSKKHWYVIKVTSNREESIKSAIERRVKIEGLEEFFGQIVIPVERITQVKKVVEKKKDTGEKVTKEKRVVKENKKYPGYLFAEVEFNDRILYLFRETSGVGDFVGASLNRAPTPMTDKEVQAMLHGIVDPKDAKKGGKTVVKLDFEKGDKVRIREGAFANSEGEVKLITDPKDTGDTPKVTVVVTIWGRPVDVELDYWQVDKV